MIMLSIPYPPSGNHMWKKGQGNTYLTKRATAYYSQVAWIIKSSGLAIGLDAQLEVEVDIYPPDKRKRDLSNVIKVVEDACTKAGLWLDDSQIDRLVLQRMPPIKDGAITLRVVQADAQSAT